MRTAGITPLDDQTKPMFYGIDKVKRGDEGGALNLWWTNAEDHSMYELIAPYNMKPITYDIWWRDENVDGDLIMGTHTANVTGFTGNAYEIEGLVNDHTYQVGVRACDAEAPPNCETNDIILKGTPTKVSGTPLKVESYTSVNTLLMALDGTPGGIEIGPTTFDDALGIVFYAPDATSETKYFVDNIAIIGKKD